MAEKVVPTKFATPEGAEDARVQATRARIQRQLRKSVTTEEEKVKGRLRTFAEDNAVPAAASAVRTVMDARALSQDNKIARAKKKFKNVKRAVGTARKVPGAIRKVRGLRRAIGDSMKVGGKTLAKFGKRSLATSGALNLHSLSSHLIEAGLKSRLRQPQRMAKRK